MTLTFQKEVAERMEAFVMTTQRCRLSVMCQNWCEIDLKFVIPGTLLLHRCFYVVFVYKCTSNIDVLVTPFGQSL